MSARPRAAAAAFTAALLLASGTPGTAEASTAPAHRTTTSRVHITGCPAGCTVTAWRSTIPTGASSEGALDTASVRHGRAVLHVPTSVTRYLFFLVADRADHQAGEGLVGVALRYDGTRVGQVVSAPQAARAAAGYDCWAGTTLSDVTFRFRAQLFPSVVNGFRRDSLRVWSVRVVRTAGPSATTFHGALPKQDAAC
ncbi:hypothetical protein CLV35_1647 [Motilibacter peucedani]|uniref:Secreted protein n=1 Tax=Motilibacter peucedani TaxID=598650 RepID=A0A420XSR3_9ACTN|nr:hypothetical protein [Motilibacter peucedani]RKS77942.1 hypothetical protein CLV35_1647 [Motilibacter peucedani]